MAERAFNRIVFDGWQNLMTGLGLSNRDKKTNTRFGAMPLLGMAELDLLFRGEGFGKKIISLLPEHMLRQGWGVSGDTDGKIARYFDKLNLKSNLMRLLKWNRAYGGAVLLMGLDDGQNLEMPVNEKSLKNITYFRVYNKFSVDKITYVDTDPASERFGLTEYYIITPYNTAGFKVHYSRILEMAGEDVPDKAKAENKGWGDPVMQSIFETLRNTGSILSGAASIVEDFITGTLNIDGLADMIAAGNENLILKRLNMMDNSRHIINTVLLDKEERYDKQTSNVSGLPDLIDRSIIVLAGVSNVPIRLLIGEQGNGLNNKGEGITQDWYDQVRSKQEEELVPILQRLTELALIASESNISIKDGWEIVLEPLWQPTMKEIAETRKLVAEADALYIDRNVLQPPEVAVSRFGGGHYSIDTTLDDSYDDNREPDDGGNQV